MVITRKYIMENRTSKGAWTKPQIEALGIDWPPRNGWIERVIGTRISDEQREIFESKVGVKEQRRQKRGDDEIARLRSNQEKLIDMVRELIQVHTAPSDIRHNSAIRASVLLNHVEQE